MRYLIILFLTVALVGCRTVVGYASATGDVRVATDGTVLVVDAKGKADIGVYSLGGDYAFAGPYRVEKAGLYAFRARPSAFAYAPPGAADQLPPWAQELAKFRPKVEATGAPTP